MVRLWMLIVVAFTIWIGTGLGLHDVALATKPQPASSNPLSGDVQAIAEGKQLFSNNCTLCHGRKADGRTGRWASKDLRVFSKGYRRFMQIVKKGVKKKRRSNNAMQAWEKFLSDEQISKIGAYLETLSIQGAKWQDGN